MINLEAIKDVLIEASHHDHDGMLALTASEALEAIKPLFVGKGNPYDHASDLAMALIRVRDDLEMFLKRNAAGNDASRKAAIKQLRSTYGYTRSVLDGFFGLHSTPTTNGKEPSPLTEEQEIESFLQDVGVSNIIKTRI